MQNTIFDRCCYHASNGFDGTGCGFSLENYLFLYVMDCGSFGAL